MASVFWNTAANAHASPLDADAMSRRGFSFRLAFAFLAALAATPVTQLSWLAAWLALVLIWEVWLAQFLTNVLVWPVYERDPRGANLRQTIVVGLGAALFGAFPFLTWASSTTLGALLALAWIGGTAIHIFVYLFNHRAQLIVAIAPPAVAAALLPPIHMGLSIEALMSSLAALYLIAAASVFAIDRNALLVDITKEKTAREAAEATTQAKIGFLNVLTHELRTPINHIIGYAGLLEEDIRTGEAQTDDAVQLANAGKTLLALVNRAIEISRLEAGAVSIELDDVEIAALLSEAAEQIAAEAAKSGNSVSVAPHAPREVVRIDSARVLACLHCLSENAAKFCKNGTITFSARRIGGDIAFTVSDTGPGIPEDAQARILQPLTQADSSITRNHEGVGLGLTLAQALAAAMQGKISFESSSERGTHFSVSLPSGAAGSASGGENHPAD